MAPNPTNTYDVPTLLVLARNLGIKAEARFQVVYAEAQTNRVARFGSDRHHHWIGFKDKKRQAIVNALKKHGWAVQVFKPTSSAKR